MPSTVAMQIIAHIKSDFSEKFGIPRQSGLVDELKAQIIFEPEFRNMEAFRGLEGYSHIWLLWQFSKAMRAEWSPTVRPPKLGGNTRVGVFATRSPFRPNAIGLSSVRLERIEQHPKWGPVLHISGADLMDQSPIYDIKPYLPYTDSHPEAVGGFSLQFQERMLQVDFPEKLLKQLPKHLHKGLLAVLAQDPRPGYLEMPHRAYGMEYGGFNVRFTVEGQQLTVFEVMPITK